MTVTTASRIWLSPAMSRATTSRCWWKRTSLPWRVATAARMMGALARWAEGCTTSVGSIPLALNHLRNRVTGPARRSLRPRSPTSTWSAWVRSKATWAAEG